MGFNFNDIVQKATGYNPGNGQVDFNRGLPAAASSDPLVGYHANEYFDNGGSFGDSFTGKDVEAFKKSIAPNVMGNDGGLNLSIGAQDPGAQLRQQQLNQASDLENPYGNYQTDAYRTFRDKQLRDLADTNKLSRHNMAKNGLYGPGSEGLQASNVGTTAQNLALGKNAIRTSAEQEAKGVRNDVLNNALDQRRTQQQMYDTVYNNALADYQNKRAALKTVGTAIGAAVGTYFAPGVGTAAGGAAGSYLFE